MMSTGYKATISFSNREEKLERTFWHPETAQEDANRWAATFTTKAKAQGINTFLSIEPVEYEEVA
jgi:hypothetical protein